VRHQNSLSPECTERGVPISKERLPRLRLAIRTCRLSFPAQVPVFTHQNKPDEQWRVATLYFVRGWSFTQLAQRYSVSPGRIRQVVRRWVERAATLGYLQRIPQEVPSDIAPERSKLRPPTVHRGTAVVPQTQSAEIQPRY
jgi:hypothetical protein